MSDLPASYAVPTVLSFFITDDALPPADGGRAFVASWPILSHAFVLLQLGFSEFAAAARSALYVPSKDFLAKLAKASPLSRAVTFSFGFLSDLSPG